MANIVIGQRIIDGPVDVRAAEENFPVALRILPSRYRLALGRIYDVARHIDDLGDAAEGDRVEQLLSFEADLQCCRPDSPQPPQDLRLRRLLPIVAELQLPLAPLESLVAANLIDQRVTTYETFTDLLEYCALSAHPIGRLVLLVFGQTSTRRERLSDSVCAALQVLEHCQDVAEDHAAGRVYLPMADLRSEGMTPDSLSDGKHRTALDSVVLLQVGRCRQLLRAGPELVAELHGWARIAVTGFVAGALATADAIERCDGDVWSEVPRPRRVDLIRHGAWLLLADRRIRA